YRNALLWHLESHGLAKDWNDTHDIASDCALPNIDSIVSSLAVRHPTMTAETATIALVDEVLPQILSHSDPSSAELENLRRRHQGLLCQQALLLRGSVTANVRRAIEACPSTQLIR